MRARSLLLALVFPLAATAQSVVPPAGEVIEVRVINVDVSVTDRKGNPIRDLGPGDFELYENGRRVPVTYFSRTSEGRLETMSLDEPLPEVPSSGPSDGPAIRNPVTWAVFVDELNMTPGRRNEALREIHQFLEKTMADGRDRGMIANIDGLAFRVREELTDEKPRLLRSLLSLQKERIHRGAAYHQAALLRNQLSRARGSESMNAELLGDGNGIIVSRDYREYEATAMELGGSISMVIEEEAQRTRNALSAAGALLDYLSRIEGRVVLLYVGAGFNILPAIDLAQQWRGLFTSLVGSNFEPKPEELQPKLEQEVQRLLSRFSSTRVTVYTIQASQISGLITADDPGVVSEPGTGSSDRGGLIEASLAREMADRTGGRYFKLSSKLDDQMSSVRQDLNDYYALGYTPEGAPGRVRRISVKVNRDGVVVHHRLDVREPRAEESAASAAMADLTSPPTGPQPTVPHSPAVAQLDSANPLGVEIVPEAPVRGMWQKDRLMPFQFKLALEKLTFVRAATSIRAEFLMHFALIGADGTLWPVESRAQTLSIPDKELPGADQQIVYAWTLDLPPLRIPGSIPMRDGMKLNVTVEDRASGARSVVTVPLPRGR